MFCVFDDISISCIFVHGNIAATSRNEAKHCKPLTKHIKELRDRVPPSIYPPVQIIFRLNTI